MRFPGTGDGVARLVLVSMVNVDMAAASSRSSAVQQSLQQAPLGANPEINGNSAPHGRSDVRQLMVKKGQLMRTIALFLGAALTLGTGAALAQTAPPSGTAQPATPATTTAPASDSATAPSTGSDQAAPADQSATPDTTAPADGKKAKKDKKAKKNTKDDSSPTSPQ